MTDTAAVKAFISKWEQNTQKESAAAKEHFVELCRLLGQPTPNVAPNLEWAAGKGQGEVVATTIEDSADEE